MRSRTKQLVARLRAALRAAAEPPSRTFAVSSRRSPASRRLTAAFAANSAPCAVDAGLEQHDDIMRCGVSPVQWRADQRARRAPRQDAASALASTMRPVDHAAVERHRALPGATRERLDDTARPVDLVGDRTERRVDRRDLRGMDRELADEPVAARRARAPFDGGDVAKLDVDRVDRGDAGRGGHQQARRACQAERELELAVGRAVARDAEVGREVFGAPRVRRSRAPAVCAKVAAFSRACAVSVTSATTLIESAARAGASTSSASSQ